MSVTTRHVGIGIFLFFLLNLSLAFAGTSIGPLPVGVNIQGYPLSLINLNNATELLNVNVPSYILNGNSSLARALKERSAPAADVVRTVELYFKTDSGLSGDNVQRVTAAVDVSKLLPGTPKQLTTYLDATCGTCGYSSSTDLQNAIYASTDTASKLATQYGYGYAVDCKNNALACSGGAITFDSYAKQWTPTYVATVIQGSSERGLTQSQIFTGLLAAGFDSGFAVQTMQRMNSFAGTSYVSVGKGDIDPTVYGDHPYIIAVNDLTYAFTNEGQLIVPSQAQWGSASTYADCGGVQACAFGGGTRYLIVPSSIVDQIGAANLQEAQQVMTALMTGVATGMVNGKLPDCYGAHGGGCIPVTDTQWTQFTGTMLKLGPLLLQYEAATGYPVAGFAGAPIDSALPASIAFARWPSFTDVFLNNFMVTSNQLTYEQGVTLYEQTLYHYLISFGWTRVQVGATGGYNTYSLTKLLTSLMYYKIITQAQADQILATSIELAKAIMLVGDPTLIAQYTGISIVLQAEALGIPNDVLAKFFSLDYDQLQGLLEQLRTSFPGAGAKYGLTGNYYGMLYDMLTTDQFARILRTFTRLQWTILQQNWGTFSDCVHGGGGAGTCAQGIVLSSAGDPPLGGLNVPNDFRFDPKLTIQQNEQKIATAAGVSPGGNAPGTPFYGGYQGCALALICGGDVVTTKPERTDPLTTSDHDWSNKVNGGWISLISPDLVRQVDDRSTATDYLYVSPWSLDLVSSRLTSQVAIPAGFSLSTYWIVGLLAAVGFIALNRKIT